MFLRVAAIALLFLHSSEAHKKKDDVVVVQPPPAKCPQCAAADTIICGKDGGCKCGIFFGDPNYLTPETSFGLEDCDPAACCESTPEQCCQDSTSGFYSCAASLCVCGGGHDDYSDHSDEHGGNPFCNTPVTCCPSFIRDSGRKLKEKSDLTFAGNEDEYQEFVDACGEHDYEVSLYVGDTHFSGIAVPASNDISAACPSFVAAHVVFDEDEPATKELLGWYNKAEGMAHFPKESAPIGTFKAKDIARAFETAEPSGTGSYELLTNNCANFLINMANVLSVKVDSTITAYVTRRLLEDSGNALVDKIKESAYFLSYSDGRHLRGDIHDKELVQLVVDARATDIAA